MESNQQRAAAKSREAHHRDMVFATIYAGVLSGMAAYGRVGRDLTEGALETAYDAFAKAIDEKLILKEED